MWGWPGAPAPLLPEIERGLIEAGAFGTDVGMVGDMGAPPGMAGEGGTTGMASSPSTTRRRGSVTP
jgi:hypothetical protein